MKRWKNRVYSRLDMVTIIFMTLLLISLVIYFTLGYYADNLWMIILYVLVFSLVIYSWFTTYFEFSNKTLIIKEGKTVQEIFYREITALSIVNHKNKKEIHGFSKKCIEIHYGKNGRETTYLSPLRIEQFYESLKSKCKHL